VAADRAARSLVGGRIGDEQLRIAGDLAREEISPTGNAQASEAFQRHLAAVLTGRAVKRALAAAGGEEVRG
jgi:CO/xanthine dehydrogenase FAD-binding subunit